ncbi:MAG TPA: hypothetical protein VIX17_14575 [Pyrinomonadaceae bacterium]|jgi:hypothetical protein
MFTRRPFLSLGIVIVVLITMWLLLARNCPNAGIAFTERARQLHILKNRTAFPKSSDFDSLVTLNSLLQSGDDKDRWQTNHAARIQGEVIDVAYARPEATNCFSPCRRDIHILIATQKPALKNEQVVVEVTPNLRDWAAKQGIDWTEGTLRTQLIGHWCEFAGWLFFDAGHAEESENTSPHNPNNWRATAWELHPVTEITVIR